MSDVSTSPNTSGMMPIFPGEQQNPPPGMPGIAPVTSAVQETVVMPAATTASNPFIPVIPPIDATGGHASGPTPVAPPPVKRNSGLPKTLIIGLIAVVLLLGIGFGVWSLIRGFMSSGPVTITYWGLWEGDQVMAGIISDFEAKNPKIKVQYIKQSHRQYRQRLQAAIDRGDGPDVFRFHNTWVPMLHSVLATVPKTVMTAPEFSSAFYPVVSRDLVAGSSIYGIPLMIDGLGLYYNLDLFAAQGIASPPSTWGELMEIVPKLTVRSEEVITQSAVALGTANNVENFSDILGLMLAQNGATLTSPRGTEAEQTLIFYHKFADPTDALYTWNESLDNSIYAFANGKVAMMFAPSWRAFDVKQMNASLRFAIAPVPQLPQVNTTWASYWVEGVSKKSAHQAAAWEFVNFLTSADSATKLYTQAASSRLFGEPYARVSLGTSVAQDPYVGAYISQAQNAISFPLASRTFDEGLNDKLIKYIEDAVNGMMRGSSPTAVLETAAAGFSQVLGSFGLTTNAAPVSR